MAAVLLLMSELVAGSMAHLEAQVAGVVVDETGHPLSGALVELWSATERLAAIGTDRSGRFVFEGAKAPAATTLLVRRIGFSPLRIALRGRGSGLMLEMRTVPFRMSPVGNSAQLLCPNRETPAARRLWEEVRNRYHRWQPNTVWSHRLMVEGRVPAERLGVLDTALLHDAFILEGDDYFRRQTDRIRDKGYAVRVSGLTQSRHDKWEFPYLESLFAGHFIDSLFGTLHYLSYGNTDENAMTIVFCPRVSGRPRIEGTLTIGTDTTLASASWRFITPTPVEEAGGEVFFTAQWGFLLRQLFPISGLYWRRLVFGYYQEWAEHRSWHSCVDNPDPRFCRQQ